MSLAVNGVFAGVHRDWILSAVVNERITNVNGENRLFAFFTVCCNSQSNTKTCKFGHAVKESSFNVIRLTINHNGAEYRGISGKRRVLFLFCYGAEITCFKNFCLANVRVKRRMQGHVFKNIVLVMWLVNNELSINLNFIRNFKKTARPYPFRCG